MGERRRPSRERASPRAVARFNSFEARFKLRAGRSIKREAENLGTSPKQKFQVRMRASLKKKYSLSQKKKYSGWYDILFHVI